MRDDYTEGWVNEASERQPVSSWLQSTLQSALVGLAEWIGMGDNVRKAIEKSSNYKGIRQEDLNKIKTNLTSRINYLLSKDELDVSTLEDKLQELSNLGFTLTGIARKRYSDEVMKIKDKLKDTKNNNLARQAWATKVQNKIDSLKGVYDSLDTEELDKTKGKIKEIEKEIGKYEQ